MPAVVTLPEKLRHVAALAEQGTSRQALIIMLRALADQEEEANGR